MASFTKKDFKRTTSNLEQAINTLREVTYDGLTGEDEYDGGALELEVGIEQMEAVLEQYRAFHAAAKA